MKRRSGVSFALAMLVAAGCSSGGGSSAGTTAPHPTSAANILTRLGVSAYSTPPPATVTNAAGTSTAIDPSTWQPLKKLHTVFSPRAELFEAGAMAGTVDNAYWEDGVGGYVQAAAPFPSPVDQSLMQSSAKASVSADIDGDGIAELVLFYVKSASDKNLYYRVRKGGSFGSEQTVTGVTMSGQSFNHWEQSGRYGIGTAWFPYLSASKADLSGTGTYSLLVADYKTVYVIDATSTSSASGWTLSVTASQTFTAPVSGIAAGDVDGDGKDEIAVGLLDLVSNGSLTGQYVLYSGAFATALQSVTTLTDPVNGAVAGGPVEPAFGCLDGSHRDQLILSTTYVLDASGRAYIFQFDPVARTLGAPVATLSVADNYLGDTNSGSTDYYRLLPRAVDLQGTGSAAVELLGQIFYTPLQASPTTKPDVVFSSYAAGLAGYNTLTDVQVGDIDNDGKQDMVFLAAGESGEAVIKAYGLLSSGSLVEKGPYPITPGTIIGDPFGLTMTIAAGNFEDNAARVRYQGHKLTFTDPIVIAVLASPPFWADLASSNANYSSSIGNWTTTFGQTTGATSGGSTSVGFSVGASIDYEQDINLPVFGTKVGEFKASIGFTNTNNWEWSSEHEVTKSVTYSATAGQDNVIFTSVPEDEYQYVIEYSPDPANVVGKSLYITIPREFSTYMVERAFFNQNTDPAMTAPIDSTVLGHTLGQPATYPTAGQKDTFMSTAFGATATGPIADYQYGGLDGTGTTVAESDNMSNGISLEIDVTDTNTTTVTHDFSVEASTGFLVGDVGATVSAGFEAGYSATSSTAAGTTFGGTVGSIPSSKWGTSYEYKSGLFARPFTNSFGRKFWVVDYWVTPLQ